MVFAVATRPSSVQSSRFHLQAAEVHLEGHHQHLGVRCRRQMPILKHWLLQRHHVVSHGKYSTTPLVYLCSLTCLAVRYLARHRPSLSLRRLLTSKARRYSSQRLRCYPYKLLISPAVSVGAATRIGQALRMEQREGACVWLQVPRQDVRNASP